MIIHTKGMREIEQNSGYSNEELMEKAGQALAEAIIPHLDKEKKILILCGKGNNGGDGFVLARILKDYCISIVTPDGKPSSKEALSAYSKVPRRMKKPMKNADALIEESDIIIDAIYGFSYHGKLKDNIRSLCQKVNAAKACVYSIDINSGAEADSGNFDEDAIRSDITFALCCYKPFHMLRKDHHLFAKAEVLSLHIPMHSNDFYPEMNEDLFFQAFPKKQDDAYKGTFGKCGIIAGSYGMAGALMLNILGAKTTGASYVLAACPDSIYPLAATRFITPVFHPYNENNMQDIIIPMLKQVKAVSFGSGCTNFSKKAELLDLVLQNATCPVVLDAEALRLLEHNYYILQFVKVPVILTPHIGEFAALVNKPVSEIQKNRFACATDFAKTWNVYIVLKGPHTIVAAPDGKTYINQSGCQALATAGSGDVLTGILTGLIPLYKALFTAIISAVWLHGWIAEKGCETKSMQNFDLNSYPSIMDEQFFKHHF